MTNSEQPLKKPLKAPLLIHKWLIFSIIGIAFIGFLDASYLTIAHYSGVELSCIILKGCEKVTTSKYATIFNIPVALLGVFYYLTIIITSLLYFDTRKPILLKIIPLFTLFGFLASLWFVYLQIFVIRAICQYCILSAITSTILFIFGLIILKKCHFRASGNLKL